MMRGVGVGSQVADAGGVSRGVGVAVSAGVGVAVNVLLYGQQPGCGVPSPGSSVPGPHAGTVFMRPCVGVPVARGVRVARGGCVGVGVALRVGVGTGVGLPAA